VDDVPILVEYLVERFATRAGKKITRIDKRTMALLQAYDWPGNVRELQNVIERAVVLCESETLAIDDAWLKVKGPPAAWSRSGSRSKRRSPRPTDASRGQRCGGKARHAASDTRLQDPALRIDKLKFRPR